MSYNTLFILGIILWIFLGFKTALKICAIILGFMIFGAVFGYFVLIYVILWLLDIVP